MEIALHEWSRPPPIESDGIWPGADFALICSKSPCETDPLAGGLVNWPIGGCRPKMAEFCIFFRSIYLSSSLRCWFSCRRSNRWLKVLILKAGGHMGQVIWTHAVPNNAPLIWKLNSRADCFEPHPNNGHAHCCSLWCEWRWPMVNVNDERSIHVHVCRQKNI